MKLPRYEYSTEGQAELFKFTSQGPKGNVQKLVVYSKMLEDDIYNLAFGDYDEKTGIVDDRRISDNGDGQKILATVASTLYAFTSKHPDAWIYATGSNAARTRLYRIGISTNFEEIKADFEVYGLQNETWREFEKGQEYEAFLVKRKIP
jgi:hypothetical protein